LMLVGMRTSELAEQAERRLADLNRMRDSLAELVARCDRPRKDRRCTLLDAVHTEDGPSQ